MILIHPEIGVRQQECDDFRLTVVEFHRAPLRMFRSFIRVGAVEHVKAVGIFAEVPRYPVENDVDSGGMQGINKLHEPLRRSVS